MMAIRHHILRIAILLMAIFVTVVCLPFVIVFPCWDCFMAWGKLMIRLLGGLESIKATIKWGEPEELH